jgi:hypothetical protein
MYPSERLFQRTAITERAERQERVYCMISNLFPETWKCKVCRIREKTEQNYIRITTPETGYMLHEIYLNPHNGIRKQHTRKSIYSSEKKPSLTNLWKEKFKFTLDPCVITEHEGESATAGTKAGYSKTWPFWPDVYSLKLWRNSNSYGRGTLK